MEEIKFISHSCISVSVDDTTLLCDSWFFGKIFEDSWCHVLEPNLSEIELQKIRYIWISHEHPDHLHWPTLKYIRQKLDHSVRVFYRKRYGSKVAEVLTHMGYDVSLLEEDTWYALDGIGRIMMHSHRYDSALLIRTPSATILNMNDCPLSRRECRKVKRYADRIDYLLFQFSLAGYHANADDTAGMEMARQRHLRMSRRYAEYFDPAWYVPFASFINFCTPYNRYMNRWRISLSDVQQSIDRKGLQIVYNGDVLMNDSDAVAKRNASNIKRWDDLISAQEIDFTERVAVAEDRLKAVAAEFIEEFSEWPKHSLPKSVTLYLRDVNQCLRIDFRRRSATLAEGRNSNAAASLCSSSCVALMTTPWGADTLNISAELEVHRLRLWRWLLFCKHYAYKPVIPQRWGLYIPRVYSQIKTLLSR